MNCNVLENFNSKTMLIINKFINLGASSQKIYHVQQSSNVVLKKSLCKLYRTQLPNLNTDKAYQRNQKLCSGDTYLSFLISKVRNLVSLLPSSEYGNTNS